MLKTFDIWCEGYAATGQRGAAQKIGQAKGYNFHHACENYAQHDRDFAKHYDGNKLTYWGCRLFDNKTDASKEFG